MRLKYRKLTTVSALALSLAMSAALALAANVTPAAATQNQVCDNGGSGYCLNDWNAAGYNGAVKMYNGNNSHEDFLAEKVDACDGSDIVLASGGVYCPFANHSLDQLYKGDEIRQIEYIPYGYCIATNGSGGAILGTCAAGGSGTGGSNGVIMIAHHGTNGNCGLGVQWYFVNRYWSDHFGTTETLESGGNPGVQAYLDNGGLGTCWGAIGSPPF
jgi:hypothetical protein